MKTQNQSKWKIQAEVSRDGGSEISCIANKVFVKYTTRNIYLFEKQIESKTSSNRQRQRDGKNGSW